MLAHGPVQLFGLDDFAVLYARMIDQFLHGDVPLPGAQNNGARHYVRPMTGKALPQLLSGRHTWRQIAATRPSARPFGMVSLGMGTIS